MPSNVTVALIAIFYVLAISIPSVVTAQGPQCVHRWTYGDTPGVSTENGVLVWELPAVRLQNGGNDGTGIFSSEFDGDVQISINYEGFLPGGNDVLTGATLSGDNFSRSGIAAIRGDLAQFVAVNVGRENITPSLKDSTVSAGRWQFARSGRTLLVRAVTSDTVAEVVQRDAIMSEKSVLSFVMSSFVPPSSPTKIRITGMTIRGGGFPTSELMKFYMDPTTKVLCSYVGSEVVNVDPSQLPTTVISGPVVAGPPCVHNWFHADLSPKSFITDDGALLWTSDALGPGQDARFIGTDVLIGDVRVVVTYDQFIGGSENVQIGVDFISTDFAQSSFASVSETATRVTLREGGPNESDTVIASGGREGGYFEFVRTGNAMRVVSQTFRGERSEKSLPNSILTEAGVLAFRMTSAPATFNPSQIRITGLLIEGGDFRVASKLHWALRDGTLCSIEAADSDFFVPSDITPPGEYDPTSSPDLDDNAVGNIGEYGGDCVMAWNTDNAGGSTMNVDSEGHFAFSSQQVGTGENSRILGQQFIEGDFDLVVEWVQLRLDPVVELAFHILGNDQSAFANSFRYLEAAIKGRLVSIAKVAPNTEIIPRFHNLASSNEVRDGRLTFTRRNQIITVKFKSLVAGVVQEFEEAIQINWQSAVAFQFVLKTVDPNLPTSATAPRQGGFKITNFKVTASGFPTSSEMAWKLEGQNNKQLCSVVRGQAGVDFEAPGGQDNPLNNERCLAYVEESINYREGDGVEDHKVLDFDGGVTWRANAVGTGVDSKWIEIHNLQGDVAIDIEYDRFNSGGQSVQFTADLWDATFGAGLRPIAIAGVKPGAMVTRVHSNDQVVRTKQMFSNSGLIQIQRSGNSLFVRTSVNEGRGAALEEFAQPQDSANLNHLQAAGTLRFRFHSDTPTGTNTWTNVRIKSIRIRGGDFPSDEPLAFLRESRSGSDTQEKGRLCLVRKVDKPPPTPNKIPTSDSSCVNLWSQQFYEGGLAQFQVATAGALTMQAQVVGPGAMSWRLQPMIFRGNARIVIEFDTVIASQPDVKFFVRMSSPLEATGDAPENAITAGITGSGSKIFVENSGEGRQPVLTDAAAELRNGGRIEFVWNSRGVFVAVTAASAILDQQSRVEAAYAATTFPQGVAVLTLGIGTDSTLVQGVNMAANSWRIRQIYMPEGFQTNERTFFRKNNEGLCSVRASDVPSSQGSVSPTLQVRDWTPSGSGGSGSGGTGTTPPVSPGDAGLVTSGPGRLILVGNTLKSGVFEGTFFFDVSSQPGFNMDQFIATIESDIVRAIGIPDNLVSIWSVTRVNVNWVVRILFDSQVTLGAQRTGSDWYDLLRERLIETNNQIFTYPLAPYSSNGSNRTPTYRPASALQPCDTRDQGAVWFFDCDEAQQAGYFQYPEESSSKSKAGIIVLIIVLLLIFIPACAFTYCYMKKKCKGFSLSRPKYTFGGGRAGRHQRVTTRDPEDDGLSDPDSDIELGDSDDDSDDDSDADSESESD